MAGLGWQRPLNFLVIFSMLVGSSPALRLHARQAGLAAPGSLPALAQLRVQIPAVPVYPASVFTVEIEVEQLSAPLSAFQFDLTYNPAVLELLANSPASFLEQTGRQVVCPEAALSPGRVRAACASTGANSAPSGSGGLLTLTFRAAAAGVSSLELSQVSLVDSSRPPLLIPAAVQNASLTVLAPQTQYAIFLPQIAKTYTQSLADAAENGAAPADARPAQVFPAVRSSRPAGLDAFWADLDQDHDVDMVDLQYAAAAWNCLPAQPCFEANFDRDGDLDIDAFDLAALGNEYDTAPPAVSITAPAEGQVVGSAALQVSGTVSDLHTVTTLTVNGASAARSGDLFQAAVSLLPGAQTITVQAQDALGAQAVRERLVILDNEGPQVEIVSPRDRQAVYTLTPFIDITYQDRLGQVDAAALSVALQPAAGTPVDITSDLSVQAGRAFGYAGAPLQQDTSYTLTVTLQDQYANQAAAASSFYVPLSPGDIQPPPEPAEAGWVSGVVYDSAACDPDLLGCSGLPGASVTLAYSGSVSLSGTIITGPDGFFAFPVAQTGVYWLRVEKTGYTYAQRAVEIVRLHSTATNDLYLTPLDPAATLCDSSGCSHTSSDGALQVVIPAGAISPGQVVTTTATNFEQVEFLPSGGLPPGTWETYAFNLGGDSEYAFNQPVTVRVQNALGFAPGTSIPLGYWNQASLQWEHAGTGVVDASGQWVEMQVAHFSNYDCNDPVVEPDLEVDADPETEDDDPCAENQPGCTINLHSGQLQEWIDLPAVNVLGKALAPQLRYTTDRANPSEVIDVRLQVSSAGAEIGDTIGWELYIEGEKTDEITFQADFDGSGEVGRYRYLWDGRNALGERLPPGSYRYTVKLSIPYTGQYCYALNGIFGNPPDCVNGATGVYVQAEKEIWVRGAITLQGDPQSPFGTGWTLDGLQRLYEDEAGRILVVDGQRSDQFYFPQKDLLVVPPAASSRPAGEALPLPAPPEESRQDGNAGIPPAPRTERHDPPPAPEPPQVGDLPPYQELRLGPDTQVCGAIDADTTWTAAGSPYVTTCDVSVNAGVTLTIESGVTVQFGDTTHDLIVLGSLLVQGSQVEPVRFQPLSGAAPGSWGRVAFLAGSSGSVLYGLLEYGGASNGMLYLASSAVQVLHTTVQYAADMGIVIVGASPTISATQLISNTGAFGGGVSISNGSPQIYNSLFQDNYATWDGGGLHLDGGAPLIQGSQFLSNRADVDGGGVAVRDGTPTLRGNTFSANFADFSGGALQTVWGRLQVEGNTFEGNTTPGSGGAVDDGGDGSTYRFNTFIGNSSGSRGGGLYSIIFAPARNVYQGNVFRGNSAVWGGGGAEIYGPALVESNIFQANSLSGYGSGGGLDVSGEQMVVRNNTFYGNTAGTNGSGGGISVGLNGAVVHNNIIAANSASQGGGIYASNVVALDLDFNDVWNNTGGDYKGMTPGANDISMDPLFVNAAGGDLHLQPGSPCIDAGGFASHAALDMDGEPRPMGLAPDIGADERRALSVAKSSVSQEILPGAAFGYRLQIANLEASIASQVVFTDALPVELHFTGAQANGLTCQHDGLAWGGSLSCAVDGGALAPGESRTVTVTVSASSPPAPLRVTSNASASALVGGGLRHARAEASTWITWCRVRLNDGATGGDLQAALDAAVGGDAVKVSGHCRVDRLSLSETHTLQGGWNYDLLQVDPAAYVTTLDGQWLGNILGMYGVITPTIAGFTWINAINAISISGSAALIQNNTFQGNAGAIYLSGSEAVVQANRFISNTTTSSGGAIYTSSGSPTIRANTFTGNSSGNGGGAIYTGYGNPLIEQNQFTGNRTTSYDGGAVYNYGGNPILRGNLFQGNQAAGYGGGFASLTGSPLVENNTFRGNTAMFGGGLRVFYGASVIRGNTFVENSASWGGGLESGTGTAVIESNLFLRNSAAGSSGEGGAIQTYNGSPLIQNNIFLGNSATRRGGAINVLSGGACLRSNTIHDNHASGVSTTYGGGIYNGSALCIANNIISSNSATQGGGIYQTGQAALPDYNDVWNNSGGNYLGVPPGAHDISADPLLINPQADDAHLAAGSPCVDAGDPNNAPAVDIDGEPRPVGAAPDIGADEQLTALVTSLTATDRSSLTYDPASGTYTRLYPDGRRVHFTSDGRHDATLEPDGRRSLYTYNADGSLATLGIIPPGESTPRWTWRFNYTNGRLASILDPAGRVTGFTVNAQGDLAQVALPDSSQRRFSYDARGLLAYQTDPEGNVTRYEYDSYGRVAAVTYPPIQVYDPDTGLTEVRQEVQTLLPGETGYALINDSPPGTPLNPAPPPPTSTLLIDRIIYPRGERSGHTNAWGAWLDSRDGLGRTTVYERDGRNNLLRQVDPGGGCTEYTYDSLGNVLSQARMGATQCGLTPNLRDPNLVQTWTRTYEPLFNQIKTSTDPLGFTTTYVYDYELGQGSAGKLVRIEHPPVEDENGIIRSPVESFTYNPWGLLASATDRRGAVTQYVYSQGTPDEAAGGANPLFLLGVSPAPGLMTRVVSDAGGENLTTVYKDFDAAGNPGLAIGPGGSNSTRYVYDPMNRLLSQTDAVGSVIRYEYDGRGSRTRQILDYTPDGITGRNVVTEYTYSALDQLLSEQTFADGLAVQVSYAYDQNRQLALSRDGLGRETVYRYDAADQLASVTDPAGYVTAFVYTQDGQVERLTDADGYVTTFVYDDFHRLAGERRDENGLALTTLYAYDLGDNLLHSTNPGGIRTCYQYDSLRRKTVEILDCGGLNLTTGYAYDLSDSRARTTDPRGTVTVVQFDALNRTTKIRQDDGGLGLETRYAYNTSGELAQETDWRGVVTAYTYDALNRLVKSCQDASGLNLCATTEYDRLGNAARLSEPNGTVTQRVYNAFGLVQQETADLNGLSAVTQYTYDNALNLTSLVDANGNLTRYTFTPRDELASESFADGTAISYQYDGRGNAVRRTDQQGQVIQIGYDGAGRKTHVTLPGGSQDFGYDSSGRLTSAAQALYGHTSQVSFQYNALHDVTGSTQKLDGVSMSVSYSYNHAGGSATITYPSGTARVYQQDALGRLDTVRQGGGASVADYTYADLAGYFTAAYANGLSRRVDYDALQRITRISSALADYRYSYDQAGSRTSVQRVHKPAAPYDVYQYDSLNRLTKAWYGANAAAPSSISSYAHLQTYLLDRLDNRLQVQNDGASQVYLPNNGYKLTEAMNRYQQVGAATLAYDARGNTLSDGVNSYTYDVFNRQVGASGSAGTAEYIYDALGRRIAKVLNGVKTSYIYDFQGRILEERAQDGSVAARYTYGAGLDEILTMERGGNTYYYLSDANGSISEVAAASGALVERYEYDAYGAVRIYDAGWNVRSASAIANPFLFNGRPYDPESGNYDFRARQYSPRLGRFLQMDPLGSVDGANFYAYARANPLTFTDPYGLWAIKINIGIGVFDLSASYDGRYIEGSLAGGVGFDLLKKIPFHRRIERWIKKYLGAHIELMIEVKGAGKFKYDTCKKTGDLSVCIQGEIKAGLEWRGWQARDIFSGQYTRQRLKLAASGELSICLSLCTGNFSVKGQISGTASFNFGNKNWDRTYEFELGRDRPFYQRTWPQLALLRSYC